MKEPQIPKTLDTSNYFSHVRVRFSYKLRPAVFICNVGQKSRGHLVSHLADHCGQTLPKMKVRQKLDNRPKEEGTHPRVHKVLPEHQAQFLQEKKVRQILNKQLRNTETHLHIPLPCSSIT